MMGKGRRVRIRGKNKKSRDSVRIFSFQPGKNYRQELQVRTTNKMVAEAHGG